MRMRYVSGMVTGALVGAVMAGMWVVRKSERPLFRRALQGARRYGPGAFKIAQKGTRNLLHFAKKRMS